MVSVDYYGPLPVSSGNVRYLFVIVDNFTKFVKLYAIRRATTVTSLRRLTQYIKEYGKPTSVLSDNGTQFTSKKWINGLQQLGIQPKFTAIRNPCTNIAERWNRQLGNLFRVFVREQHSKWATYISTIETCLNEVYQETIKMTPHEAHFGQKPKRKWEKFLDDSTKEEGRTDPREIYSRIRESRSKQAEKLNQKLKLSEFQNGEKVLVRTYYPSDAAKNIISKFCELYEGPYLIKNKLGKATYELTDCQNPDKSRGKFNIRQLKRYRSDSLAQ